MDHDDPTAYALAAPDTAPASASRVEMRPSLLPRDDSDPYRYGSSSAPTRAPAGP